MSEKNISLHKQFLHTFRDSIEDLYIEHSEFISEISIYDMQGRKVFF